jgi:xylulokinase
VGGARSALRRQMMADIFQAPVASLKLQEQSALGAVILAGLGAGMYHDAAEACRILVTHEPFTESRSNAAPVYQELFALFNALYTKTKADIAKSILIKLPPYRYSMV